MPSSVFVAKRGRHEQLDVTPQPVVVRKNL